MQFKDYYQSHNVIDVTPKDQISKPLYHGNKGAGVFVFCSKTKRFLLGLRSEGVDEPNTWGIFGGALDETLYNSKIKQRSVDIETQRLAFYKVVIKHKI